MKKSILDKKKIRERLSNLRASFDNKTLNTCSLNAQLNLLEFLKKKKFQNIGFFISFNSEVSTHFLLSKLKKKIVPKIFGTELKFFHINDLYKDTIKNKYGILEPNEYACEVNIGSLDALIVPGLAFTVDGKRLGYGGGYYDKLLSMESFRAYTIGFCFKYQIIKYLPTEAHDKKVDYIITD